MRRRQPYLANRTRKATAATFVATFVFLLGLVSCSCNCEDDNPELRGLNDRAEQGDVKAIVALYNRYSNVEKIPTLADYWLFRGAIAGEPVLRKKYVTDYRNSYLPEIRTRQL